MFCGKCGAEVEEGHPFCPKCGASLNNPDNQVAGQDQQTVFVNNQPNTQQQSVNSPSSSSNKNSKKPLVIAIVCVGVAVIAAIVIVAVMLMNRPNEVSISVSADGYNVNSATDFPIVIEGPEGSETKYIDTSTSSLSFKNGDYTVNFVASALCENGNFYKTPDSWTVHVNNGKAELATPDGSSTISYKRKDAIDITDDEIAKAKEYAKDSSHNADKADTYADKTKQDRDTTKAEKAKKEQEEAAAAAAAAAEQAKAARKAQAATKLTTGRYMLDCDTSYVMDLDMENKKLTVTQNGTLIMNGELVDKTTYATSQTYDLSGVNYGVDYYGVFPRGGAHPMPAGFALVLQNGKIVYETKHMDSNNPFLMKVVQGSWVFQE